MAAVGFHIDISESSIYILKYHSMGSMGLKKVSSLTALTRGNVLDSRSMFRDECPSVCDPMLSSPESLEFTLRRERRREIVNVREKTAKNISARAWRSSGN
jgi:hypothetical protein